MACKFFYICAGMFLLALAYHLGANTAGAAGTGLISPTEVAVRRGVLNPGELIPLPVYADGTTALEADCQWITSLACDFGGDAWCYTADTNFGPFATVGRTPQKSLLEAHMGRIVNSGQNQQGLVEQATVSYLVIAVRGASQPTSALRQSWGQVKARYRTPAGGSVTPGTVDR